MAMVISIHRGFSLEETRSGPRNEVAVYVFEEDRVMEEFEKNLEQEEVDRDVREVVEERGQQEEERVEAEGGVEEREERRWWEEGEEGMARGGQAGPRRLSTQRRQALKVKYLQDEIMRLRNRMGEWDDIEAMYWRRIRGLEQEVGELRWSEARARSVIDQLRDELATSQQVARARGAELFCLRAEHRSGPN